MVDIDGKAISPESNPIAFLLPRLLFALFWFHLKRCWRWSMCCRWGVHAGFWARTAAFQLSLQIRGPNQVGGVGKRPDWDQARSPLFPASPPLPSRQASRSECRHLHGLFCAKISYDIIRGTAEGTRTLWKHAHMNLHLTFNFRHDHDYIKKIEYRGSSTQLQVTFCVPKSSCKSWKPQQHGKTASTHTLCSSHEYDVNTRTSIGPYTYLYASHNPMHTCAYTYMYLGTHKQTPMHMHAHTRRHSHTNTHMHARFLQTSTRIKKQKCTW